MNSLIGFNLYGDNDSLFFRSFTPPIQSTYYLEIQSCVVDEIHIREKTEGLAPINSVVLVDDLSQGTIE